MEIRTNSDSAFTAIAIDRPVDSAASARQPASASDAVSDFMSPKSTTGLIQDATREVTREVRQSLRVYQLLLGFFGAGMLCLVAVLVALAWYIAVEQQKVQAFSATERALILDTLQSPAGAHQWSRILPTGQQPEARLAHAACSIGEMMWIHGGVYGFSGGGTPRDDMWRYDHHANTWAPIPFKPSTSYPRARLHHSMNDISLTEIVLYGGFDAFVTNPAHTAFDDMWVFDTVTSAWALVQPATGSPVPTARGAHDMIWANGHLYLFGGQAKIGGTLLNELWRFQWSTKQWTNLTTGATPPARIGAMWSIAGEKAYLFGGACPTGADTESAGQCNDNWSYEWSSNTWTRLYPTSGSPPQRRAGHGDASIFGLIYIFGGIFVNGTSPALYDDFWVFDPQQQTWMRQFPNFGRGERPPRTFGHTIVAVGRDVVLFGGRTESTTQPGTNQLWEYKTLLPKEY